MELGEKIRTARLEAGLSQRQLCGDTITRNMLSLIEHGSARPSMDTLRVLASRLGKPISFFLDEEAVTSPNQGTMADARAAFQAAQWEQTLEFLKQYQGPDPVFEEEHALLEMLCLLEAAEQALREERRPYSLRLLEQAGEIRGLYCGPELERRRLLLLARAAPETLSAVAASLPSLDPELQLRARAALEAREPHQALAYLAATEDQDAPAHQLLQGEARFVLRDYETAALHFLRAEEAFPGQVVPRLEICYRELGNYQKAYEYACKQR